MHFERAHAGLVALLLLTHCGGKAMLDEPSASGAAGSGTRSEQGGASAIASGGASAIMSNAGAATLTGTAGQSAGGASSLAGNGGAVGENGGANGGVTSGGSGGLGPGACITDADCAASTPPCLAGWCSAGECEFKVDQNNLPPSSNPCLSGTCNANGMRGITVVPMGTRCMTTDGGAFCDGSGNCVQCLKDSDCTSGFSCSPSHQCVAAACTGVACAQCRDQQQDGTETGLDCGGGVCRGCAVGQMCFLDADCAYPACDADTLKCITNQCADHRQDGSETDVDCGGPDCPPCATGRKCLVNFDCHSGRLCVPGTPKVCN